MAKFSFSFYSHIWPYLAYSQPVATRQLVNLWQPMATGGSTAKKFFILVLLDIWGSKRIFKDLFWHLLGLVLPNIF